MSSTYDKIILISLDTLRSDCIAANPHKLYPNEYNSRVTLRRNRLDEILEESCFFANTITAAPYTSASHASYFTGLWQKNNGVYDQFNSKLQAKSIFEYAAENGYRTIFKTDFPLILGKYLNLSKGVQHYFIEDDEGALRELQNASKSLALFHFGQIHYPYGFHSLKYGGQDYKDRVEKLERKFNIPAQTIELEDMAVETFHNEEDLQLLFRYKAIVSYLYRNRHDDELFNLYLEGINYFHEHKFNAFLDRLLSGLEGQKYLIVLFGDHGEAWNNSTYGHHNASDEGVLRVPLLFYGNNIRSHIHTNRVRTIDVVPTLAKLMNLTDAKTDGEPLDHIILEHAQESHRDAFSAVWVNELEDIINKTNHIFQKGSFETEATHSIRYNACYYQGQYKYIQYYKKFVDRSEKLKDDNTQQLYDMQDLGRPKTAVNDIVANQMQAKLDIYNTIHTKRHDTSDQLRQYFNLQGYNI